MKFRRQLYFNNITTDYYNNGGTKILYNYLLLEWTNLYITLLFQGTNIGNI